jgi:hypothetical protein
MTYAGTAIGAQAFVGGQERFRHGADAAGRMRNIGALVGAAKRGHPGAKMRLFYEHLRLHPSYYLAAQSIGKRLAAKDPAAEAAAKELLGKAKEGNLSAINTCKAIGVVMKYEHMLPKGTEGPYGMPVIGFLPAASTFAGKLIRLALSPIAWTLGKAGQIVHWGGDKLTSVSHAL